MMTKIHNEVAPEQIPVDDQVDIEAAIKTDMQITTTPGRSKLFFLAILLLSLVSAALVGYTVWYFFFKTGCGDDDVRLRRLPETMSKVGFQA
jgi:hypothetical protein